MKQRWAFAMTLFLAGCSSKTLKSPDKLDSVVNKDSLMLMQMSDSLIKAIAISSQPRGEIVLTASYLNKRDSFSIHFAVKNTTDSMYYFHIGAEGWRNNKWNTLIMDLNALGKMDFAFPKPLKPGVIYTARVSLAAIREEFGEKLLRVKFSCYYYKKPDFFSPCQVMYSQEFNIPANTKR